jgi:methionyl-tRNA synthetase
MPEKPFFITTPIYYINATPHIGHAYTQIGADARARFERLRGRDVYFLTGTDENAEKIARVARAQGRNPQEFCDELAQAFRDVWDALEISYDDYLRTTETRHRVAVQRVFEKLWQDGQLYIGSYSGWYSVPDETFFRDEETIERDGQRYLANPTEDQTKAPLEWVEEKSHFFKLSEFSDYLLDYYAQKPDMLQPEARRNETLSFIRQGLRDTSISRQQEWGIPVPESVPEHEGHVIYVWFPDALANYFTAPGFLSDDPFARDYFERVWPPDLQLMSKDIFTRFHATLWPALLKALGLEQPKLLFAHGFWTVKVRGEIRKISKRDPETIVEPVPFAKKLAEVSGAEFLTGVDALRYYMLREVPFGVDGIFSRLDCAARYNSDLANGLGNLVNRALSMLKQYFDSELPRAESDLGLIRAIEEAHPRVAAAYEALDFSGALATIWECINHGNRLIEEQKPWAKWKEGDRDSVAALMRELFALCIWVTIVLNPVLPHSMNRLRELLNVGEAPRWEKDALSFSMLDAGHKVQSPQPLFPRIQDLKEENLMETQQTEPPAPTSEAPAAEPENIASEETKPSHIEYDDFAKVQLRVGRVVEAERVPKADKLLRLVVDLGDEKRQILAGIAQQYAPEEMIGKNIVVVANLAPRKLRGLESQGMLLAASPSADAPAAALLTVDADVPPGSVIR